jgi:mannose-1-phosphate guanylyltransferase/phosphomannomutase
LKGLIITWAGSEALRSLTQNRSISLLPIANRSLLEHQVALLSGCGIRELIVVAKRGAEEELGPILDRWEGLSYRFFTPVADNLLAGLDPGTDSTLVVLLGPLVTDLELARALAFHRGREARATLILHTVRQHPRRSLVLTDQRGRVTRVLPRVPAGGGMARTAGGLYILEPDLLSYLAGMLVTGKEEEICPHLLGAGIPVYGFPVDEYWLQVEDPAAYLQVHRDILHGRTRLKPEGTELSPGVWCGSGVKVAPDVRLVPPVILGDGVELKEGVRVGDSVLGAGTYVDVGTEVSGSVLQENCYLGKGVQARGIIMGEGTIVAGGAVLRPGILLAPQSVISRDSLLGGAFDHFSW